MKTYETPTGDLAGVDPKASPVVREASSISRLLTTDAIRELLRAPGPCLTLLLPPYHAGERNASSAARLKTSVQDIARELVERNIAPAVRENLLKPLQRMAEDSSLGGGSHAGCAVFRSPGLFERFIFTQPTRPSSNIGGCFSIRPLLPELALPKGFYILNLSKTHVTLLRCTGLAAEIVDFPPRVQAALANELGLEPPDHDTSNRSSAGTSLGAMNSVRFGTGSGRESKHARLADFYKLVDPAVRDLLDNPEAPLILAGVAEDTAIYRTQIKHRGLAADCIPGSHNVALGCAGLLVQAQAILRKEGLDRDVAALMAAREQLPPTRIATDIERILDAAFQGRISELYLSEAAEAIGESRRRGYRSWGPEDLLNVGAVQTLLHRGKVAAIPAPMMPDGVGAVATLRA